MPAPVRYEARRTAADEELVAAYAPPDYLDSFQLVAGGAETHRAESWARSMLEVDPPRVLTRAAWLVHRHLLRFELAPLGTDGHVLGWRVESSAPDLTVLAAHGPLMAGHMVWRVRDDRLRLTTFLHYTQARRATAVWAVIGHLHRASPRLLGLLQR